MRIWKRAPIVLACGNCPRDIKTGEAYLEISIDRVRDPRQPPLEAAIGAKPKPRARCQRCADEPCPPDLPELEAPRDIASFGGFAHIRTGAADLPFDFKAAQTGEREPGSDDD